MQSDYEYQALNRFHTKTKPNSIIGFYKYIGTERRIWQSRIFTGIEPEDERGERKEGQARYSGELTAQGQKKLKEAIEILYALATPRKIQLAECGKAFSFSIALITLTLSAPQGTLSDIEIKKQLLEPFLRHFRKRGLLNYVWKAEQQKNGNVHFHLLTDTFIDKTTIQNFWNKLQAKLGFIEIFHQKHGHRNPPSTQVKAVRGKKGMRNYMLKYMLKIDPESKQMVINRPITQKDVGRIWDCSLNLKLKNDTTEMTSDLEFELLQQSTDTGDLKVLECDFCTVFVPRSGKVLNDAPEIFRQRLQRFLDKVRNHTREAKPRKSSRFAENRAREFEA